MPAPKARVKTLSKVNLLTAAADAIKPAHIESIKALCLWAEGRGYLEENPLEDLAAFAATRLAHPAAGHRLPGRPPCRH